MSKLWEYMSRDEKLDYIKERLDSIDSSLAEMLKLYQGTATRAAHPVLVQKNEDTGS